MQYEKKWSNSSQIFNKLVLISESFGRIWKHSFKFNFIWIPPCRSNLIWISPWNHIFYKDYNKLYVLRFDPVHSRTRNYAYILLTSTDHNYRLQNMSWLMVFPKQFPNGILNLGSLCIKVWKTRLLTYSRNSPKANPWTKNSKRVWSAMKISSKKWRI